MSFMSDKVPITHIVKVDIESLIARRTWQIGRSSASTDLNIRDRGLGSARLIDYGTGLEARLVPEPQRRALPKPRAGKPSGG